MFDVGPHTLCGAAVKIRVNVSRCMSTCETESCSPVSTRSPWKWDSVLVLRVILSPTILSFLSFSKFAELLVRPLFSVYQIKLYLFISFSFLQMLFFLCLGAS